MHMDVDIGGAGSESDSAVSEGTLNRIHAQQVALESMEAAMDAMNAVAASTVVEESSATSPTPAASRSSTPGRARRRHFGSDIDIDELTERQSRIDQEAQQNRESDQSFESVEQLEQLFDFGTERVHVYEGSNMNVPPGGLQDVGVASDSVQQHGGVFESQDQPVAFRRKIENHPAGISGTYYGFSGNMGRHQ